MNISEHGGECCGVRHLFNFYNNTNDAIDIDRLVKREKANLLFEVVLTDDQCAADEGRLSMLKERKFRHVARWYNSNSGNYCNLFVKHRFARAKRPFKY